MVSVNVKNSRREPRVREPDRTTNFFAGRTEARPDARAKDFMPGGRGEKTRDQILEAAHNALAQVGYEKITTRRIAREAGVNIATLHYYFGTKEVLLSQAVRFALSRSAGTLRAAMETAPDARGALVVALETAWLLIRERPGILRYDLAVRGFRDAGARNEADAVYAVFREIVREVAERHLASGGTLARGLTPESFAWHVVSVVDGVSLQYAISGDEAAANQSFSLIREHALFLMESDADSVMGSETGSETGKPEINAEEEL